MNRGVRYCARLLGSLCPAYHVPGSSERVGQSGFGHADELDVACPEFAPGDVRARVPGEWVHATYAPWTSDLEKGAHLEVVLNSMSNKNAIFDELSHRTLHLLKCLRWVRQ